MAETARDAGFGLYVHWPFCAAKCPYCDFNSHVAAAIDHDVWRRAYLAEIGRIAAQTPDKVLNTIFFGGGTPSLMDPGVVAAVIDAARTAWRCANDMEITLEANPGSVEAGRFAGYRDAGVNRVSLGVQALNDADLRRLGRIHTVAEATAALDIARSCFDRVSFDLIYARQNQSLADWRAELSRALDLGTDHLSLYQLTVEDGTAFADRLRAGRLRGLPDEDLAADLYDLTQELCTAAGLPGYEISNHARPGAESRHNLIYWRGGDYAGIGPGAHGRLSLPDGRFATETPRQPGAWLAAVVRGNGESARIRLDRADQVSEYLIMCLRVSEGLYIDRFTDLAGQGPNPPALQNLAGLGLIASDGHRLWVTARGRPLLNRIVADLLPDDL